ncbi:MAG: response regulator [Gammaproteobacteria bacterium]|nr:response regulator [Gammaproteobacteria bacterium]
MFKIKSLPILKRKRISLGCNFVLLVIGILSVTMSTAAYINYQSEHKALLSQLKNKGELLGTFVADVSKDAILGYDFVLLDQYMEDIADESEIVYSIIITPDHTALTSYLNDVEKYTNNILPDNHIDIIKKVNLHADIIAQKFPIFVDDKLIATLAIGLTKEKINELSWIALRDQLLQNGLIIFILSFSIAIVFRNNAVKPILELINSANEIANGKLDQRVIATRTDELARLAESFNSMTHAIQSSNIEKDKTLLQLRETNKKLEKVTQAKSEFLANMSHEIRTPLTAILGYAETLKYENAPPMITEEAIKAILENGQHLQHIISEILDLTKIEANKLEIENFIISPVKLANEFESLISLYARSKHLDFRIVFNFPLPEKIETDPVRLKQILLNLCNNAIKFTQSGSVTMYIEYLDDAQLLQIKIKDTGIGLTLEQQQKIFQPFVQADTSTTRQFGGTGLGLSLSQKLAIKLGGDITVHSAPGDGSTFTLTIATGDVASQSLVYDAAQLNSYNINPARKTGKSPLLKGKILLAEDTIDNQRLFSLQINRLGADLEIANNGAEALELIQQQEFDLVLMDMQMPVMGGIEAVKKIRRLGITTPIVALTANAIKEYRDTCIKSGCTDYLSKPVDWNLFRSTLAAYLTAEPEQDPVNPLYSKLVEEDPDFEEIISGFLEKIPDTKKDIQQYFNNKQWGLCQAKLHELKGLGGAMGYPDLGLAAKNIESRIKSNKFKNLDEQMGHLYDIFDRMIASHKSVKHAS